MKKYIVRLEAEEREKLWQLVNQGKAAAYRIRHAHVLLAADQAEGGPAQEDGQIAKTLGISVRSIEYLRQRLVEEGLEAALGRRPQIRPSVATIFDGEKEAKLIAVACGPKPAGKARWTMQLLADRVVQLKIVPRCSDETVRRVLKKTS
jgi:hypothetical protein